MKPLRGAEAAGAGERQEPVASSTLNRKTTSGICRATSSSLYNRHIPTRVTTKLIAQTACSTKYSLPLVHCLTKRITTQESMPTITGSATKLPAKELLAHAQSDDNPALFAIAVVYRPTFPNPPLTALAVFRCYPRRVFGRATTIRPQGCPWRLTLVRALVRAW